MESHKYKIGDEVKIPSKLIEPSEKSKESYVIGKISGLNTIHGYAYNVTLTSSPFFSLEHIGEDWGFMENELELYESYNMNKIIADLDKLENKINT